MSGELGCVVSSQALSQLNGTGLLLLLISTLDSETLCEGTSDVREFGGKGKYVSQSSLTSTHQVYPG